jgi:hypothetical protein
MIWIYKVCTCNKTTVFGVKGYADIFGVVVTNTICLTASSNVSSRRSSQLSLTSVDSMASSSMATSMTSGMSRSYPQSPDGIPPIDPMAVHEIENQARLVADSLDLMMGNLRNNLHQVRSWSGQLELVRSRSGQLEE